MANRYVVKINGEIQKNIPLTADISSLGAGSHTITVESYQNDILLGSDSHTVTVPSTQPVDEIALYEMETTTNGLVDKYGNYNGTLAGSINTVIGKVGNAFEFGGNANAVVNGLTMPDEWTIEFWLYKTNTATEYIVSKQESTSNRINIYSGGTNAYFRVNGTGTSGTISNSAWNHIVMAGSNLTSSFTGYINGNVIGNGSNVSISGTTALYIGSHETGYFLNGLMDDFRIHNKRLSDTEVLNRFNSYT